MITARMDTTTAAGHLTDSVTTTLIITVIALCLQLLVQEAVLLEEVLRRQTHILTLEYETHLLLLIRHDVTCTEMTEGDVPIEPITDEADRLIPRSQGNLRLKGPQGKPPKLLIPLKEPPYLPGEAQDRGPAADLQVPTLSAALAAQAAAGMKLDLCMFSIINNHKRVSLICKKGNLICFLCVYLFVFSSQ